MSALTVTQDKLGKTYHNLEFLLNLKSSLFQELNVILICSTQVIVSNYK